MKVTASFAALSGILLFAASSVAEHPHAPPTYHPGCTPASPSYPHAMPQSFGGDCTHNGHSGCCGAESDCGECPQPGYCKQIYYKCKAKIHACFARHHQPRIQSPVFRTHPFARSPRDFYMYD